MDTRTRLRTPQVDDVADLLQREAEPARLGNEVQDAQDISVVRAIPRWRPPWLGHDAACFVESQRLGADTAPGGHLSNPECLAGHEARIDLAA